MYNVHSVALDSIHPYITLVPLVGDSSLEFTPAIHNSIHNMHPMAKVLNTHTLTLSATAAEANSVS